jgi:hypothetical protein
MEDKEFYKLMKKKKREINTFDINEEEKQKLYQLVGETIERYEENKIYSLKNKENFIKRDEGLKKHSKGLKQIEFLVANIIKKDKMLFRTRESRKKQTPENN